MRANITAVLLAGGSGSRLRSDVPKQFSKLAGRSILEHAFLQFDAHRAVADIIVVIPDVLSPEQTCLIEIIKRNAKKPLRFVVGGATRNMSTRNAIALIEDDNGLVLIHDAARPLVSADIVTRCIGALGTYDAVDVVIDCADTIVEVDAAGCIKTIPDRSRLRRGQTPQGFKVGVLRSAYALAQAAADLNNTDDCGVVLRYRPDVPVKCVVGSESNMKVTHPIDLVTADRMFQHRMAATPDVLDTGVNRPDSLKSKSLVVFGSSSGIGRDICLRARELGADVAGFSLSEGDIDVRKHADVMRALESVHQRHGRIDGIVNATGVLRRGHLAEMSVTELMHVVDTNLLGAFLVAREGIRFLRETQGHLVFFTSSSYTRGRSTYSAYSAAKAGVVNMAQALAEETADLKIKVNCVNPERTATRMRKEAFPDEDQSTLLDAKHVAEVTLALFQSDVTGQVIDVRR